MKKVVNCVDEKMGLSNIYKPMQVDPLSFINLFFLLIFCL
ncbi:hypothetical protein [Plasmodium yoelii yoelii]|uniref:Uncharacterized protein n=1 Tax=Plasmodium yoelii yoelii TaxID=73239 RepID=Q7RCC2_PLAYO|nr:hypothetical protein [Plasmodium yoelii yoelii]